VLARLPAPTHGMFAICRLDEVASFLATEAHS
jgi:hypothetical protein